MVSLSSGGFNIFNLILLTFPFHLCILALASVHPWGVKGFSSTAFVLFPIRCELFVRQSVIIRKAPDSFEVKARI